MENIFEHIYSRDKLNQHFLLLDECKGFKPAKNIIGHIASEFIDNDGNFIEQFQTFGFSSRMWELFLFKFFKENNFSILNDINYPDFHLKKEGVELFVEASTSNEKNDDIYTRDFISMACQKNDLRIQNKLIEYYVIRLGSVLFSKLKKKYWESEWVQGKPLVLAISPFHNYIAKFLPDAKIIEYLYGLKYNAVTTGKGLELINIETIQKHSHKKKEIPSNFFAQDNVENISAVIFTNNSDLHKFNRIGYESCLAKENILMRRYGLAFNPEPNSKPIEFTHNIIPGIIREDWNESVILFHNPNAIHKIDHKLFPNIRHVWVNNKGELDGIMPKCFIYNSITGIMVID